MSESSGGLQGKVANQLAELGCCTRCIARFCDDLNRTRDEDGDLSVRKEHEDAGMNPKKMPRLGGDIESSNDFRVSNPAICTACLGLLQESNLEQHVEEIYSAVKASGYEFHSVSFLVTAPLALLVMQHSIMVALSPECRTAVSDYVHSVKDSYKELICQELELQLNTHHSHQSQFKVDIYLSHSESEGIVKCLCENSGRVTSTLLNGILSNITPQEFRR
jgi:hypothetical protein